MSTCTLCGGKEYKHTELETLDKFYGCNTKGCDLSIKKWMSMRDAKGRINASMFKKRYEMLLDHKQENLK